MEHIHDCREDMVAQCWQGFIVNRWNDLFPWVVDSSNLPYLLKSKFSPGIPLKVMAILCPKSSSETPLNFGLLIVRDGALQVPSHSPLFTLCTTQF